MDIFKYLNRMFSKEAVAAAAAVAVDLVNTEGTAQERHQALSQYLDTHVVEVLDDTVEAIPGAGPIIKGIVDSPIVDGWERQGADVAARLILHTVESVAHLFHPAAAASPQQPPTSGQ